MLWEVSFPHRFCLASSWLRQGYRIRSGGTPEQDQTLLSLFWSQYYRSACLHFLTSFLAVHRVLAECSSYETMETADFQYTSLDPRQIRVLQRVPDDQLSTNMPSYRLLPVDLDSDPEFVAVSYVWGEPSLTREISISGKTLKVTNSLYNAVQDAFVVLGGLPGLSGSQCREETSLWVDGVCIN